MLIATPLQPATTWSSTPETFDASVASDGLTLDTPLGPVDLVAIERARAGRPVTLTPAELVYLVAGGRS